MTGDLTVSWALGQPAALFQKTAQEMRGRNLLECLPARLRARWRRSVERALEGSPVTLRNVTVGSAGRPAVVYSVTLFRMPPGKFGAELGMVAQPAAHGSAGGLIERFLHDEVGQPLGAAGLELDLLRLELAATAPFAVERIDRVQATLESLMERVREFTRELQGQTHHLPFRKESDAVQCPPGR